jgi:DNA polymerase IV
MKVLRSFGHPVEVWGWDEAYLGAGCGDLDELPAPFVQPCMITPP